ncbi:DNA repair protein RecO [Paenibacillus thalictri]|uniref:DNA repair protein RecO n=1 Tax=Paenibacillus thalictri TaxID=2527873 RepID=A0A4Q9DR59_9BACL|nr:DNA repair protein RecO [Paenibacillus thalictri]TBL78101.1 DNA repair protein RecO [Paenibacillus thalictri]
MLYRVEAIVIRSTDYGEGNKIVTLFSREAGKVSVMVRGAKKMNSRYAAVVQPFTCGQFVFFKNGQMGTLNNAEIIQSYHMLREDLLMAACCSYLAELTDRLIGEQENEPYWYEQLKAAFQAMTEGKDADIIVHIYEMKMLAIAGYTPQLDQCVSCGETAGEMAFSFGLGGILCKSCRRSDPQTVPLSGAVLKLLRLFSRMDIRRLGQTDVKPETKQQLKTLLRGYMDNHLGLRLKSRNFLEQMEKYGL